MSVPILRLRLAGYCGACSDNFTCGVISDTEEQKTLQNAVCSLQAVPIIWYRKVREKDRHGPLTSQRSRTLMKMRNKSSQNSTVGNKLMKMRKDWQNSPKSVVEDKQFKIQHNGLNSMFHTKSLFNAENKDTSVQDVEEVDDDDLYYAGIEAEMSVCDSDEGPSIEIKAHGLQFSLFAKDYEIVDIDPKFDIISSFLLEGTKSGHDFLERTIPLSLISHASPGGYLDWKNMINLSSGNCDCAVKVYGVATNQALVSSRKKLLLMDVLNSNTMQSEMSRDELIDALNILLVWDKEQRKLESQVLEDNKGKKSIERVVEAILNNALCC